MSSLLLSRCWKLKLDRMHRRVAPCNESLFATWVIPTTLNFPRAYVIQFRQGFTEASLGKLPLITKYSRRSKKEIVATFLFYFYFHFHYRGPKRCVSIALGRRLVSFYDFNFSKRKEDKQQTNFLTRRAPWYPSGTRHHDQYSSPTRGLQPFRVRSMSR